MQALLSFSFVQWIKIRIFAPLGTAQSARVFAFFIGLSLYLERVSIVHFYLDQWALPATPVLGFLFLCLASILFRKGERVFLLFLAVNLAISFVDFRSTANHVFLAQWLLVPLIIPQAVEAKDFAKYVRRTLGLVMIGAASQKLISGNFLDGAMLQYLLGGGFAHENMIMAVMCPAQAAHECGALVYASILSVVWQYAIGFLLLFNCRHIAALLAEVVFVLGVGFAADEMNFQTLNVAALLLAFRVQWPVWAYGSLAGLLVIDHYLLENLLKGFF